MTAVLCDPVEQHFHHVFVWSLARYRNDKFVPAVYDQSTCLRSRLETDRARHRIASATRAGHFEVGKNSIPGKAGKSMCGQMGKTHKTCLQERVGMCMNG